MKTKWMLVVIGGLIGIAVAAPPAQSADLQPMFFNVIRGELGIQQNIPCGIVSQTTPAAQGRLEIAPAAGIDVPGGKRFVLTRVSVAFAPFSITASCAGFSETRNYTEVGVQLGQAVAFIATHTSTPGLFNLTIPKDDVLLDEAATVNGDPEAGFKKPSQDVTGTLDLVNGIVSVQAVVATRIHMQAGCVGGHCAIDEFKDGTLSATLTGKRVFPDADGDGVPDATDNCRLVANPDQTPVASPVITAPAGVMILSCAESRIGLPTAVDACDGKAVVVTNSAPATFLPGRNVVTWTAVDAKGRSAASLQVVTVADATLPAFTFVPPNLTMNTCGAPALGTPIATDDCGTPTLTNNAPAKFGVGATTVTWTASDGAGNRSVATQEVTVTDTVAPKATCVLVSPLLSPPPRAFRVGGTDACTATPRLQLGSYALVNGETITIDENGRPGVVVLVVGRDGVKHFQVGRGEAVITAMDGSGNVASASCGSSGR